MSATAAPSTAATAQLARRTPEALPSKGPADLVVRLELAGDTCCPVANVVVTTDGRVVSRDDDNHLLERKLSRAGVRLVRDEVLGTGLFEHDTNYPLEARVGATPPQRGFGLFIFAVGRESHTVRVTTATDQGPDESAFVPSAARSRLDRLARQLKTLETWLPAEAWDRASPQPYLADTFVLLTRTYVGLGNVAPTPTWPSIDALAASWPFDRGPLAMGDFLEPSAGPEAEATRCAAVTRADAVAVRRALERAGPTQTSPEGAVGSFFAIPNGTAIVSLRPQMPDRTSCRGEYVS